LFKPQTKDEKKKEGLVPAGMNKRFPDSSGFDECQRKEVSGSSRRNIEKPMTVLVPFIHVYLKRAES
jgi:hypothetical protein